MNYRNIEENIAYHTFLEYHLMIYNLPKFVSVEDTFKASISVPSYLLGVFFEHILRTPMPRTRGSYKEHCGEYFIKQSPKDEIIIKHELLDFNSYLEDMSRFKNTLLQTPTRKYLFSYSDGIESMKIPIDDLQLASDLMRYFLKQKIIQYNKNVKWVDSLHPSFDKLGHGLYYENKEEKLDLLWKNGEPKVVFKNIKMFYERNEIFDEVEGEKLQLMW
jgi:hypothetical protein